MLPLAQRHEDRARRIAMNRSDGGGNPAGSVSTAENLFRDAITARARLTDAEKAELDESLQLAERNGEFDPSRSLAEAPDGSGDTLAGIGTINTKVVPGSPEGGNGGGDAAWPVLPEVVKPEGSNAAGAALQEQGLGSGQANGTGNDAGGSGGNGGSGWGSGGGTANPLDGNVDAVTAHAGTVSDPAEIDRLIEAETAGQNRTGALKALNARKDALAAA